MPLVVLVAPLASVVLLSALSLSLVWLTFDERSGAWPWQKLARGWVWLPLLLVMACSALWAIDVSASLALALRLAVLVLAGLALSVSWHSLPPSVTDRLIVALGWGTALAAAAVALDMLLGCPMAGLFHGTDRTTPLEDVYSRGTVFLAIIMVPLGAALWERRDPGLSIAVLLTITLTVLVGVQASAKVALLAGVLVAFVVYIVPQARWVVLAAILLGGLSVPWSLPHQPTRSEYCWLVVHKPSALHRMLIWNWVDARIEERPLLGWGLDASRRMPGGHSRVVAHGCDDPPGGVPRLDNEILPLHPHDAGLQIWLELGAAGALAATFALGMSVAGTYRQAGSRLQSCALAAALTAAGVAAAISFGIWQEWWFAILWLSGWVATTVARPSATS